MGSQSNSANEPAKRGIILRWVFSYLAVFVIPFVVFIVVSMNFMGLLDREVRYYNALSVDMIRLRMDYILNEVNTFASEAAINPMTAPLISTGNRGDLSPLMLSDVIKELNRLQISKDQIENFLLYFPAVDLAINGYTYNDGTGFYQAYLSNSSLSLGQWRNLIGTSYSAMKLFDFSYEPSSEESSHILIIRPLSYGQRGRMYANVVFIISRDTFLSAEGMENVHSVLIVDRIDGSVMYDSSGQDQADLLESGIDDDPSFMGSNKNLMIASVDSRIANWRYIISGNRDDYFGRLILFRRIFILCLGVCFFLGFLFVALIVKYNWNSLNRAMKLVSDEEPRTQPAVSRTKNEYQYFSNAIFSLQKEKSLMSGRLQEQQKLLKSQVILNMLENSGEARNMTSRDLEFYGISFQHGSFIVLLVQMSFNVSAVNEKAYLQFAEDAVSDVFLKDACYVFPFHHEKYLGFVINSRESDTDAVNALLAANLEEINALMLESSGAGISSSCSNVFLSYTELNTAYMQALDALEFNNRIVYGGHLFYRDIIEITKQKNFTYTAEQELRISEEIKKGNAEQVLKAVQDTIDSNLSARVAPRMMRYLLFNIAGTVIKVYNRLDERVLELLPDISMPAILRGDDFDEIYGKVKGVIRTICSAVEKINSQGGTESQEDYDLYRRILMYVKDSYADKTLNVSSIADHFDVSVVHLSRVFKKLEGVNLSDYINIIRISHAKKILNSEETLSKTADVCGFGSFRTFMRVFKKCEGITPGQYKSMHGNV
ncbi:helix-turn-helix transcriptional regulator [Treponema sp. OttesenSCG-928-L16]|nr:helix-turn-helix transcriptional regulator [Treponema sp. OttesenSCG-928-L16]